VAYAGIAANPDRGRQRGAERRSVIHLDDPVAALALPGCVGTLELDEVGSAGTLLPELQAAGGDREVGVALPDLAEVLGSDL
jgi:hypothetical protein